MTSIDTSYASTAARYNTRDLNTLIALTKKRIASGLKFTSASDDRGAWDTYQRYSTENVWANTTIAGLANARSLFVVASSSATSVGSLLSEMAIKVTAAMKGGDATAAALDIQALQAKIRAVVSTATTGRVNMLDGSTSVVQIPLGWNGKQQTYQNFRPGDVYKKESSGSSGYLGGTNGVVDTSVSSRMLSTRSDAQAFLNVINQGISMNTQYQIRLDGVVSTIDNQTDMLSKLINVRSQSISSLVDADLDEEGARLKALLARQTLIKKTLSITNSTPAGVLKLFR